MIKPTQDRTRLCHKCLCYFHYAKGADKGMEYCYIMHKYRLHNASCIVNNTKVAHAHTATYIPVSNMAHFYKIIMSFLFFILCWNDKIDGNVF